MRRANERSTIGVRTIEVQRNVPGTHHTSRTPREPPPVTHILRAKDHTRHGVGHVATRLPTFALTSRTYKPHVAHIKVTHPESTSRGTRLLSCRPQLADACELDATTRFCQFRRAPASSLPPGQHTTENGMHACSSFRREAEGGTITRHHGRGRLQPDCRERASSIDSECHASLCARRPSRPPATWRCCRAERRNPSSQTYRGAPCLARRA